MFRTEFRTKGIKADLADITVLTFQMPYGAILNNIQAGIRMSPFFRGFFGDWTTYATTKVFLRLKEKTRPFLRTEGVPGDVVYQEPGPVFLTKYIAMQDNTIYQKLNEGWVSNKIIKGLDEFGPTFQYSKALDYDKKIYFPENEAQPPFIEALFEAPSLMRRFGSNSNGTPIDLTHEFYISVSYETRRRFAIQ